MITVNKNMFKFPSYPLKWYRTLKDNQKKLPETIKIVFNCYILVVCINNIL